MSKYLSTLNKKFSNLLEKASLDALSSKGTGTGKGKKKTTKDKEGDLTQAFKDVTLHTLHCLLEASECDFVKLWNMGLPEESFISIFPQVAMTLLSTAANVRDSETLSTLLKLIAVPLSRFSSSNLICSTSSSLINYLNTFEHGSTAVVALIEVRSLPNRTL